MFCLNLLKNGIHYYTVFQWKYFFPSSFLATLLLSFLLSRRRYGTLALCSSVLRDAAYSGQVAHCTYPERPFPLRSTWRSACGMWNNPQRHMLNLLLSSRSTLNVWYLPVCFQDSLLVVSKSFTVSSFGHLIPSTVSMFPTRFTLSSRRLFTCHFKTIQETSLQHIKSSLQGAVRCEDS